MTDRHIFTSSPSRNRWMYKNGLVARKATCGERDYARDEYGILDCDIVVHDSQGICGYGDTLMSASRHYCAVSGTRPWDAPQIDLGEN
jgi:hypothetical protein